MSAAIVLPEGYAISTDPALLNLDVIHGFISQSYWAKEIPKATVERAVKNSLCWGVYERGAQVGFARVMTDKATFAYLADVFILPEHRGKGLSKALVATILAHPDLQGLRRWMLVTADAQGLYEPFGFKMVPQPERHMEIHRPDIYQRTPGEGRRSP
jgi:N-acetylglutamate synthase-like GNAT family acetyltransferase